MIYDDAESLPEATLSDNQARIADEPNSNLPQNQGLPLGLLASSCHSTDPRFLARAKALESENLDQIMRRLIIETGCNVVMASTARREFLRLCALRFLTGTALSPNVLADEFWHAFLVHTKAYREFCIRHFKRFIDHEPVIETSGGGAAFAQGKKLYRDCFGEEPAAWRNDAGKFSLSANLEDRIAAVKGELLRLSGSADGAENSHTRLGEPGPSEAFTQWRDWDNSWKNWGQFKNWDKWSNWDRCS